MKTLGEQANAAPTWQSATGIPPDQDPFTFPYLGDPWSHDCTALRSTRLRMSAVIPVFNSARTIGACLTSLRLSSLNRLAPGRLEVIVCDDGSTDSSWQTILDHQGGLNIRAYQLPHRSQSTALNFGLQQATGEVVVSIDSDMLLGCGALDELLARHERWNNLVCFGFRSDLPAAPSTDDEEAMHRLMHTEAFSGDNRLWFDTPTLVPNMLVESDWLGDLSGGRYIMDSRGWVWRRHRLVYGALFSALRAAVDACDGFPDAVPGWGYADTLITTRLEANGAFILPVICAWGHHVWHDIRHADQWFRGSRNELAYEHLLAQPLGRDLWRRPHSIAPVASARTTGFSAAKATPTTTPITGAARSYARLGWWKRCLQSAGQGEDDLVAEALFRLGHYEELCQDPRLTATIWAVIAAHRSGDTKRAASWLNEAAAADPAAAYAASASRAELRCLAAHYGSQGMEALERIYLDVDRILTEAC